MLLVAKKELKINGCAAFCLGFQDKIWDNGVKVIWLCMAKLYTASLVRNL